MSGWDVTALHEINGREGLGFQFLDGLHFSGNTPSAAWLFLPSYDFLTQQLLQLHISCDDPGAKRCWDYWEVPSALEKKVLIFGSASALEGDVSQGECWDVSKEPGSEMWSGKSWAGGEAEKKICGNWGGKKFLLFPHSFAAHENCWFNNSSPSNPLKKLLLFPEIHFSFIDRKCIF